ncbi:hypothetical protein Mapa_017197 [Marchantia paleacea]|nr:hypothetical protein Mapa_017197 [Marchantia paleacea]
MSSGERTWEVMVLFTLSCAAFLIMFIGVSNWSELNRPGQVPSPSGSVLELDWRAWEKLLVPEVNELHDGGVVSKPQWIGGFANQAGNHVDNPLGFRSGFLSEYRPVQEVEDEGVLANVRSFFAAIGDSVRSWQQKTISPPAILHATEPLGRFPHSDMPPTSILLTKLTAIVGKIMEEYYANSVAAYKAKTCSGILEEQTRTLVKLLKGNLKEKLCTDDNLSGKEETFCNFYSRHPKLATLMVFSKLEIDPVGVALMRTTTSELCASSNDNLVHNVHKMEKLSFSLGLSLPQMGTLEASSGHEHHEHHHEYEHEHEHEHEHERKFKEHGIYKTIHLGETFDERPSCKDCYLQGIRSLMKNIKALLYSTCAEPSASMAETCAFVKEHRYLVKTYVVLKNRLWKFIFVSCNNSCQSSTNNVPHLFDYPQTTVSQSHAPDLPGFGVPRFIRRLDAELPMRNPDMPDSHFDDFGSFMLEQRPECHKHSKLSRQMAFRIAIQLRANFLASSHFARDNGVEGNGQGDLMVVANGHPFGPSEMRDFFGDLEQTVRKLREDEDSRPNLISDVLLFKPYNEHMPAAWKRVHKQMWPSVFEQFDSHGESMSDGDDADTDALPDKAEEQMPSDEQLVTVPVEESVVESASDFASDSDLGESTSSSVSVEKSGWESVADHASVSESGESTSTFEDSSENGSRAAM